MSDTTHTPSGYHLHLTLRFQDEWILTAEGAQEFQRLSCEVIDRFFGRKAEVVYQFPTGGYSGCYVLAESHYNYHTYPEHRLAAVDVYYCSDGIDPDDVVEAMKECFGCEVEGKIERRGDDRKGLHNR